MTDRKKILETGLQMEIDANRFYAGHADKVDHPGTRKMLLEMADEEAVHVRLFKAALDGKPVSFGKAAPAPGHDLKVGETLRDDLEVEDISEPGDILVVAIKAEMKAIKVYSEWAEEFKGTDLEPMLKGLVAEETAHKYRLEKIYNDEYLTGN